MNDEHIELTPVTGTPSELTGLLRQADAGGRHSFNVAFLRAGHAAGLALDRMGLDVCDAWWQAGLTPAGAVNWLRYGFTPASAAPHIERGLGPERAIRAVHAAQMGLTLEEWEQEIAAESGPN